MKKLKKGGAGGPYGVQLFIDDAPAVRVWMSNTMAWVRIGDYGGGLHWEMVKPGDDRYPYLLAFATDCQDDWPALVDFLIDDPRTADAMAKLLGD